MKKWMKDYWRDLREAVADDHKGAATVGMFLCAHSALTAGHWLMSLAVILLAGVFFAALYAGSPEGEE